jgi:hypothetical protein
VQLRKCSALLASSVFISLIGGACATTGGSSSVESTQVASATPLRNLRSCSNSTPNDIRCQDWNNIVVPASVCNAKGTVRLREGKSSVYSDAWPEYDSVEVVAGSEDDEPEVVYGDLDQDGHEEALLALWCTNGSGTASGQLGQGWVVFRLADRLRPVGEILPRTAGDGRPTYIGGVHPTSAGLIVTTEYWYGRHDMTCCPRGRARTTWQYKGGRVSHVATVITRQPPNEQPG